jgi:hypothetical protein
MKQRPIVVLDRIRTAVVLDRIRMAVSAKWIRREREANDEAGRSGLHRFDDPLRTGSEPMHGGLYFSLPCDFLGEADAKIGSEQRGERGESLNA